VLTSRSEKTPVFFSRIAGGRAPTTSGWLSTNDAYDRDFGRRRKSYPSAITGADAPAATVADVAAAPELSWAPPTLIATPPHATAATAAARAECAALSRTAHREIEENELERIASGFLCTSGHDILFGAGNR